MDSNDTRETHKTALDALHQLRTLYRRSVDPSVTRDAIELSEIARKAVDALARTAYAYPPIPLTSTRVCEIIRVVGPPTRPIARWVYTCWKEIVSCVCANIPPEPVRFDGPVSLSPDIPTKRFRLDYAYVDLVVPPQIKSHSVEDAALDDALRILELAVLLSCNRFIGWEDL